MATTSSSQPRRRAAAVSKNMTQPRTPSLDLEQAVIEAASALLLSDGPEALSIRKIAAAAGVAPQSMYNRFGSKQGVIDTLFIKGFLLLDDALSIVHTGDAMADFVTCGQNYRRFALDNPALYAIMFSKAVPDYEPSDEGVKVASQSFLHLVDAVTFYQRHEEVMAGDPIEIAQGIWSLMHGTMSLELAGIGFIEDRATYTDNVNRTMIRGLAPHKGEAKSAQVTPMAKGRARLRP